MTTPEVHAQFESGSERPVECRHCGAVNGLHAADCIILYLDELRDLNNKTAHERNNALERLFTAAQDLASAREDLAEAQRQLEQARKAEAMATEQLTDAQELIARALDGLSGRGL